MEDKDPEEEELAVPEVVDEDTAVVDVDWDRVADAEAV